MVSGYETCTDDGNSPQGIPSSVLSSRSNRFASARCSNPGGWAYAEQEFDPSDRIGALPKLAGRSANRPLWRVSRLAASGSFGAPVVHRNHALPPAAPPQRAGAGSFA